MILDQLASLDFRLIHAVDHVIASVVNYISPVVMSVVRLRINNKKGLTPTLNEIHNISAIGNE